MYHQVWERSQTLRADCTGESMKHLPEKLLFPEGTSYDLR